MRHMVRFEDLSRNAFMVTISRVQQVALRQAGAQIPSPKDQLALIQKRRQKKTREDPSSLVLICCVALSFNAWGVWPECLI